MNESAYILLEPSVIDKASGSTVTNFADYLSLLFKSAIMLAVVIAVFSISLSGILYIISWTPNAKAQAKTFITESLLGLAIALIAWLVLWHINPSLVNFNFSIPKPTP